MRRDGAAARVTSKSDELVQGRADLLLPVLSILAVDEPSSFFSEDV